MIKNSLILVSGIVSLMFLQLAHAQQTQSPVVANDSESVTASDDQAPDTSGLTVEEVRIRNRLDRVIIQHGEGGLSEYYELNDGNEIYQDGSLTERGVLRQWRIGGGKP